MAKQSATAGPAITDIETAAADIQSNQIANGRPPLTGVEIAAEIGAKIPPPPPPGTKYLIRERADKDAESTTVTSEDGTIEDAVRAFNAGSNRILTAKQLVIEVKP